MLLACRCHLCCVSLPLGSSWAHLTLETTLNICPFLQAQCRALPLGGARGTPGMRMALISRCCLFWASVLCACLLVGTFNDTLGVEQHPVGVFPVTSSFQQGGFQCGSWLPVLSQPITLRGMTTSSKQVPLHLRCSGYIQAHHFFVPVTCPGMVATTENTHIIFLLGAGDSSLLLLRLSPSLNHLFSVILCVCVLFRA